MLKALHIERATPRDKPYKLSDGDGLYLLIETAGSKLWRFRYRFAGKEKMISFGAFPAVTLASARSKREEAKRLLADGKDPSEQKREDKLAAELAARNTFGAVAEEHLQVLTESHSAPKTLAKNNWLLRDLAGSLWKRPIAEITSAEILAILKKVEKSGRRETAKRLRGAISTVFCLAVATLRAPTDPTYPLRKALAPPVVRHRPAITDEAKLGACMVALDEYDGWPTLRDAMHFMILTMARPVEVRKMRRSEVNWPQAKWIVPAERMKMRRPHDVPLSKQALAVLRRVWDLSDGSGLVFPSIRSAVKPLSENAMNSALRRMGYTKEEVCAHGFRTSASTILNQRGYDKDVIEKALSHEDEDEVRATYNRSEYWPQRVKLLQDWADLLDAFRVHSTSRVSA
jgi:integrase